MWPFQNICLAQTTHTSAPVNHCSVIAKRCSQIPWICCTFVRRFSYAVPHTHTEPWHNTTKPKNSNICSCPPFCSTPIQAATYKLACEAFNSEDSAWPSSLQAPSWCHMTEYTSNRPHGASHTWVWGPSAAFLLHFSAALSRPRNSHFVSSLGCLDSN